jgi:signal transduction histidine kinase
MGLKLSLTQKGLILVSIPLCFEIGFVVLLTNLQKEAEKEAQRAVEAHKIADHINRLTGELFVAFKSMQSPDRTQLLTKGYVSTTYKSVFARVGSEYAELSRLTADKPELNLSIKQSNIALAQGEQILNQVAQDIDSGNLTKALFRYQEKADRLAEIFKGLVSKELLLVAKHESDFASSSDDRQAQIRKKVLNYAVLAIAGNVIFSLVLAIFLVRNVTSRIKILSDNAIRLAANQPVERLPAGNDEIGQLDRVFHEMADALAESARSKQEIVNMLTHDLRSPLAAIHGTLEILQVGQGGNLSERGEKLVKLANHNSARMMGLINDLLDIEKIFSNMMTIEKDKVCLAQIFEEVRVNTADWIEEHGIRLNIMDTDLFVTADCEKLSRVVFNLVSNAIKFSPKGGTIGLAAKQVGADVEVTVSDQGLGIPPEMVKRVFDRFQQVDSNKKTGGSGLGLYICHVIVGLHGGKIWVTSEVRKGSVFHFTLPAA